MLLYAVYAKKNGVGVLKVRVRILVLHVKHPVIANVVAKMKRLTKHPEIHIGNVIDSDVEDIDPCDQYIQRSPHLRGSRRGHHVSMTTGCQRPDCKEEVV